MDQFTQDVGDLLVGIVFFGLVIGLPALWLERRARQKREPEILPPPSDVHSRNLTSVAEWRRKRGELDRIT